MTNFRYLEMAVTNKSKLLSRRSYEWMKFGEGSLLSVQNILSFYTLPKNVKIKTIRNYNFTSCFMWVWNFICCAKQGHRL